MKTGAGSRRYCCWVVAAGRRRATTAVAPPSTKPPKPEQQPGGLLDRAGPRSEVFNQVERWVVFSDLHVSRKSLEPCLEVLQKVHQEAQARDAGILFLGEGAGFWHQQLISTAVTLPSDIHTLAPPAACVFPKACLQLVTYPLVQRCRAGLHLCCGELHLSRVCTCQLSLLNHHMTMSMCCLGLYRRGLVGQARRPASGPLE